jgi:hypothetical protein
MALSVDELLYRMLVGGAVVSMVAYLTMLLMFLSFKRLRVKSNFLIIQVRYRRIAYPTYCATGH